jgi:hypothetical protein
MRRARLSIAILLGALLAVAVIRPRWAERLIPVRAPKNVLLVSLDTLRADRLGSYGYAVVPLTLPAHSSLHRDLPRLARRAGQRGVLSGRR